MTKKWTESLGIGESGKNWLSLLFLIAVLLFGYFMITGGFKTESKNPLEGKKAITTNTTCAAVKQGAELMEEFYGTPQGITILAQCEGLCNKEGLSANTWKCIPPQDEFICYCNLK